MQKEKKVAIIGSGIGGLSSALVLLKLGYDITIIEKNREPGGMMRSYKRRGIDCPVGIHYLGSLDSGQPLRRIFDYLGVFDRLALEKMGTSSPIDKYIFDDFSFDFPSGIDAYEDNLLSSFPDEKNQISAIMGGVRKTAGLVMSFAFPFGSSDFSLFSLVDMFNPMAEYLNTLGVSSRLKSVLEVPCTWIGLNLKNCPMFLHYSVLLSYLFSSWRLTSGGADMADVFVSRIKELGGRIILGQEAEKILIEKRIANGVMLKSGEMIEAGTVIATMHPKTMLGLLPEASVKPAYIKRISTIEDTDAMFSAHYTLDAKAHPELPYNIFRLKADHDGALSVGAFFQLRKTDKPDMSLLSIITSDLASNWKKWENTISGKRGAEYIIQKEKKAKEMLDISADFLGPLERAALLDAYTPLTIRDWVASPEGSTYGILRSSDQIIKTASMTRTSVKGLFLAGQSVLAPGILGTVLGSLVTARDITGAEIFINEVLNNL